MEKESRQDIKVLDSVKGVTPLQLEGEPLNLL